jgi:hypothetical protein
VFLCFGVSGVRKQNHVFLISIFIQFQAFASPSSAPGSRLQPIHLKFVSIFFWGALKPVPLWSRRFGLPSTNVFFCLIEARDGHNGRSGINPMDTGMEMSSCLGLVRLRWGYSAANGSTSGMLLLTLLYNIHICLRPDRQ